MTKKKATLVIIHGAYGAPSENWFPWLADEVRKLGHDAVLPELPTPEGQSLDSWTEGFERQVGSLTRNMVMVGHSLAPAFILSLLEKAKEPVRGTFLVSGFLGKLGLEEFDPINETIVCREFDWSRIRRMAGEVHVYNSDDDPYVPFERGTELAEHLGVDVTVVKSGGHINAGSGFKTFPMLLGDIQRLLKS